MRANAIFGLVQRLLTQEAAGSQDQEVLIEAAEHVAEKLRAHLSKRIGQEGFRTLLVRALTLATGQFPPLSAVRVGADGSLIGLRRSISPGVPDTRTSSKETRIEARLKEIQAREAHSETVDGAVVLLATFLELLVTFIGEDLTLRILSAIWPEAAFDEATHSENGGENERP